MRRWWLLTGFALAGCASDYDGESYPQVVEADEIQIVGSLPTDARVIGIASDSEAGELDGSSISERLLSCNVEDRLIRRMKRTAAREGGEFLVEVYCETTEDEDSSAIYDDPNTSRVETSLYCETYCEAGVARRWVHDS